MIMRLPVVLLLAALLLGAASCEILESSKLEGAVKKALKADDRTSGYSFEVSVQGEGHVKITGTLGMQSEIEAVSEIAKSVEGVKVVTNMCKLEESSSGMMQDSVVPSPFL